MGDKIVECLRALSVNGDVNKKVVSSHNVPVAQLLAVVKSIWYKLAAREKVEEPTTLGAQTVTALLA